METFLHRLNMLFWAVPLYLLAVLLFVCCAPYEAARETAAAFRRHW